MEDPLTKIVSKGQNQIDLNFQLLVDNTHQLQGEHFVEAKSHITILSCNSQRVHLVEEPWGYELGGKLESLLEMKELETKLEYSLGTMLGEYSSVERWEPESLDNVDV